MNPSAIVVFLIASLFIKECFSLTLRDLIRRPKQRKTYAGPYPNEAQDAADSISRINIADKSFIRPIGSIAGKPVIPRRWTYGSRINDVFIDENGVAFPVRSPPSLNSILRSRLGRI